MCVCVCVYAGTKVSVFNLLNFCVHTTEIGLWDFQKTRRQKRYCISSLRLLRMYDRTGLCVFLQCIVVVICNAG